MKKKVLNVKVLVLALLASFGAGFIGTIFQNNQSNSEWYLSVRPAITPPAWVFPIVWNILFLLIALSIYLSWTSANKKQKPLLLASFALNLTINATWTFFYFNMQNPLLAFIDLILLIASVLNLIILTYRINKTSSYLLIPYLLWLLFASILNYLSI